MTNHPETMPPSSPHPKPRLVVGKLTLTGPTALIVALLLIALFLALVAWLKPSIGMLVAGVVWFGFVVF